MLALVIAISSILFIICLPINIKIHALLTLETPENIEDSFVLVNISLYFFPPITLKLKYADDNFYISRNNKNKPLKAKKEKKISNFTQKSKPSVIKISDFKYFCLN